MAGSAPSDELPIGGKGGGYNLDDIPIGGGGGPTDELPLCGKGGGYNLDNLEGAFADPNAMVIDMGGNKPKKAPPKKFGQKPKA